MFYKLSDLETIFSASQLILLQDFMTLEINLNTKHFTKVNKNVFKIKHWKQILLVFEDGHVTRLVGVTICLIWQASTR